MASEQGRNYLRAGRSRGIPWPTTTAIAWPYPSNASVPEQLADSTRQLPISPTAGGPKAVGHLNTPNQRQKLGGRRSSRSVVWYWQSRQRSWAKAAPRLPTLKHQAVTPHRLISDSETARSLFRRPSQSLSLPSLSMGVAIARWELWAIHNRHYPPA